MRMKKMEMLDHILTTYRAPHMWSRTFNQDVSRENFPINNA